MYGVEVISYVTNAACCSKDGMVLMQKSNLYCISTDGCNGI